MTASGFVIQTRAQRYYHDGYAASLVGDGSNPHKDSLEFVDGLPASLYWSMGYKRKPVKFVKKAGRNGIL